MPCIMTGSSAVARGTTLWSMTKLLTWVSLSDKTAATVTSEPVPAVVGITNKGNEGFRAFNIPISCFGDLLLAAANANTFEVSIVEPPPTAKTLSDCEFVNS